MYKCDIIDAQYVAIRVYVDKTGPNFLVKILQRGNKGGKGEEEVGPHAYILSFLNTCLNENKKGGETSKSKILRIKKEGI